METKYAIDERVDIWINRAEASFDRACDEAYQLALSRFDVDDDGHINAVSDSSRSTDSMQVRFVSYGRSASMSGHNHTYLFAVWVSQNKE